MEIPYIVHERPDTGLTNGKLGIWLFLASEVMLFGALFSTYISLRTGAPVWPHGQLNVPLGALNTVLLIASSVTMRSTVLRAPSGTFSWPCGQTGAPVRRMM